MGDNNGILNLGVLIQQGTKPGASKDDLRRAYLARVLTQANQLPLFVGDSANAQVRLSAVYTALLTQRSETETVIERPAPGLGSSPERTARRLSALDVLNAERKLVLLGGPGSGKSTFVNFVALGHGGRTARCGSVRTLRPSLRRCPKKKASGRMRQPQRWDHGALLPVQVVLRD